MVTALPKSKSKINRFEAKTGDIFSEESHYVRKGIDRFLHLESGDSVSISDSYMEKYFDSADQFTKTEEVGKEDKYWTENQVKHTLQAANSGARVGDLRQKGIRTIWSDIHSGMVFTVNFNKQSTEVTDQNLMKAKMEQLNKAVEAIEEASRNKKGVKNAALEAIQHIQNHPVQEIMKGEERTLRGYKIQFTSINGAYNVIDMDKPSGENQRQVNVNNINWLIVNGTKYIVK